MKMRWLARSIPVAATLLALAAGGLAQPALAQGNWRDAQTGQPVLSGPIIVSGPSLTQQTRVYRGIVPEAGDPSRAFDRETGRNFVRDKSGTWRDTATGQPVLSGPIIVSGPSLTQQTHVYRGIVPEAGDPNRAFDPTTGRNFVRNGAARTAQPTPTAPPQQAGGARYDSPGTGGFIINPNIFTPFAAPPDYWTSALRYAGEFSGFRIAAGVGLTSNDGETDYRGTGFSASDTSIGACFEGYFERPIILHVPSGLFVSSGYMAAICSGPNFSKDNGGVKHETELEWYGLVGSRVSINKNWVVQGGISQNWFGIRRTSLYGESGFAAGRININVPGFAGASETETGTFWGVGVAVDVPLPWGTGVVQNIDAAAMELYLGYRHIELDAVNARLAGTVRTDTEIDVVTAGARIKF